MRASMILIVLLLAGCASPSDRGASPRPPARGMDTLCMDDCLGAGGNQEFCEDRCTY